LLALQGYRDREVEVGEQADRDTDLRVIEGYCLTGGRPAAVREQGVTLWDSDRYVVDLLQQRA
jgi:hypothetical protein